MHHPSPPRSLRALWIALAALLAPFTAAGVAVAAPFYYIDPVTPYGEIVNQTYQLMMWLGIVILIVVEVALVAAIVKFRKRKGEVREPETWAHNTTLEIVWTVIPFVMLIVICVPTFKGLLYLGNVPGNSISKQFMQPFTPEMTLEVVGRQFFWEYRYPELNATFNSSMRTEQIAKIQPGTKDWDALALYVPVNRKILVKLTGADVIHSWWVPAFGMQQMTTPANLVQVPLEVTKTGDYEGACAYLCGPLHGAMDIKVKAVDQATFDAWVAAHKAPGPITSIMKAGKIGMVAPPPQKPHGEGHGAAPAAGAHASPAPAAEAVDVKALAAKGEVLYVANCAACHKPDGTGQEGAIPPLAGAEQVNGPDAELIDIVVKGRANVKMTVKGKEYAGFMPPFGGQLTADELAAIMTYVRTAWGNNGKPILPAQVKGGH